MKNQITSVSRRKFLASLSALSAGFLILPRKSLADAKSSDAEVVDIAPVWAGHPVAFALLTKGDQQFAAFYNAQRQMTLAQRTLGDKTWKFNKLPTFVKWDSHNSISMALDSAGCLHVSGNMHAVPLVYFRGSKPLDIDSVAMLNRMTGQHETSVTYPQFYYGPPPSHDLIFSYRDGASGDGNNLFNVYNPETQTWQSLLAAPLMDGMSGSQKMNAYMQAVKTGTDGYYHMSWVWRNTRDASTCHDLSYMRSRDLVHWETIDGTPLTLPITIATPGVIVDPVPVKGGISNAGMGSVGFDSNNQVVISYGKYDANGKNQLYLARFENGAWQHYLASDWTDRIEFNGGGSMVLEIYIGPVLWSDGKLTIRITRKGYGSATWEIDPQTMKLAGKLPPTALDLAFAPFTKVESSFPGMEVKWSSDTGETADGRTYRLRWETLPQNRDKPRNPPLPPPSMLRVIGVNAV